MQAHSRSYLGSGVLITATRLPRGPELSVLRTDASRSFRAELAACEYAFAVASESGFAFLEKVTAPVDNLAIALSSACHRTQGRVTGTLAPLSRVSFSRGSTFTGDRSTCEIVDTNTDRGSEGFEMTGIGISSLFGPMDIANRMALRLSSGEDDDPSRAQAR